LILLNIVISLFEYYFIQLLIFVSFKAVYCNDIRRSLM